MFSDSLEAGFTTSSKLFSEMLSLYVKGENSVKEAHYHLFLESFASKCDNQFLFRNAK